MLLQQHINPAYLLYDAHPSTQKVGIYIAMLLSFAGRLPTPPRSRLRVAISFAMKTKPQLPSFPDTFLPALDRYYLCAGYSSTGQDVLLW